MEQPQKTRPIRRLTGWLESKLGWATADRRVEAHGELEQLAADDGAPVSASPEQAEDVLDDAELHIRNDHGDLAPDAEPDDQPVAANPKEGG